MDMLILAELQEKSLSGYDIIGLFHKRFNILVSSGTVYSLLYSMERSGLIDTNTENRKRVYTLTPKGEETLDTVSKANGELHGLMQTLLS